MDMLNIFGFLVCLLFGILAALIIIAMIVGSIIIIIRDKKTQKNSKTKILPLLITFFLVLTLLFVPISLLRLNMEYSSNRTEYHEVVELIESGDISDSQEDVIPLPSQYKHLSKGGGDVIITKAENNLSVLFFTVRGITDNYSGFAYISDNSQNTLLALYPDIKECIKKENYWYWISCS
jgi:hypothetical protein